MNLAAEIDKDGFAPVLANPDTDRKRAIRPQGEFGSGCAIAGAIATVRRHQSSITEAAQNVGNSWPGEAGMLAEFHTGQRTVPADRLQNDADISVGDFP